MKPNAAAIILRLLNDRYTIADLLGLGLEASDVINALGELTILANGKAEPTTPSFHIVVPFTDHGGLLQVAAIKTLRVIFNIGLKQAKELYDQAGKREADRLVAGAGRLGRRQGDVFWPLHRQPQPPHELPGCS